jgi:cytochrome b561
MKQRGALTNMIPQVSSQTALYNERIAIVFGIVTLLFGLATFVSCRTFVSLFVRLGLGDISNNKIYRAFNRYHLYYWWFFGILLIAHIMMATLHTGLPQSDDPDAGIHWIILVLGLAAGLTGIVVFFSCRVLPKLLGRTKPRFSLTNKMYRSFFIYHAYYWWLFILLVTAHFTVSFLHVGFWPTTE